VTPLPPPMLMGSQFTGGAGGTMVAQVFLERRMIAQALAQFAGEQQALR